MLSLKLLSASALLAASVLVPTANALLMPEGTGTDADGDPCWDGITEIDEFEVNNVTDFDERRIYVLCPETTYEILFVNEDGGFVGEGNLPLALIRNQEVWCGKDGSSANNCIINGGTYSFGVFNLGVGPYSPNMVMRGLTFTTPFTWFGFANFAGSLNMIDCIFKQTVNTGALYAENNPFGLRPQRNRRLREAFTAEEWGEYRKQQMISGYLEATMQVEGDEGMRVLQGDNETMTDGEIPVANETQILFFNFSGCVFSENAHLWGVFTIVNRYIDLTIENTIFEKMEIAPGQPGTWFLNTESKTTITDSCIVDSEFFPVAFRQNRLEDGKIPEVDFTNFFINEQECAIATVITATNFTCTEESLFADTLESCLLTADPETDAPVAAPASSPVMAPVEMAAPGAAPVMAPAAASSGGSSLALAGAAIVVIAGGAALV